MNGKSTRQERTRAYTGDLLNGRDQSNIDKVGSRKLAVTAVAGAAAVTGTVELIWPMGGVQSEDRPSQRLLCVLLGTGVGAVGNKRSEAAAAFQLARDRTVVGFKVYSPARSNN